MKLYLTSERHALTPALCSAARRLSPTAALQWQESVPTVATAALVPAGIPAALAPAALAPSALVLSALVPAAHVAGATGSVRGDLTVRVTESADRTDVVATVTTDELHVASAALLDQRGIRVQGTTGFSAKHSMTAPKPNGGVRGIPPRGRPV
ncbi:hypothetical protein [Dactylosporangium sp. CS-033363]|uniref:hypothetical protein n=1 Tax=Dactylosporangium sp. CS-033363 TaxID=3239935 RepID=UPI003D8E91FA